MTEKCSALLTYLRSADSISKLETIGVYLRPKFAYNRTPPAVTGYTANNTISFELPVGHTGAILSGAIENGAMAICSVSFKAAEAVRQQARLGAVKDTVKKATDEARAAAQAADIHIGKTAFVKIDDSFNEGTVSRSQPKSLRAPAHKNATQVS